MFWFMVAQWSGDFWNGICALAAVGYITRREWIRIRENVKIMKIPTRKTAIEPGDEFSRLTVQKRSGTAKDRHALWLCLCTCGREKVVSGHNLVSGNTQSCGCLNFGKKMPERKEKKSESSL